MADSPPAYPVLITTKDNRLTGLLREVEEALRAEDDSLALWRAEQSLRSLSHLARGLGWEINERARAKKRRRA